MNLLKANKQLFKSDNSINQIAICKFILVTHILSIYFNYSNGDVNLQSKEDFILKKSCKYQVRYL